MTVLANTLRDRTDDIIADLETQFARVVPAIEPLAADVLDRGSRAAYAELQGLGRSTLAPMIDYYGLAAGTLAAEWYDINRDLLKVGGSWGGAVVQDPNLDTGPMIGGVMKDFTIIESVIAGVLAGMDLRVRQTLNGTLMDSVLRDTRARGWGRVASAGCCSFCGLLASRGAVYRTQHTATFCPHTNCHCMALPLWQSDPTGVSLRSREDTIATRRTLTDRQRAAQNAQAQAWIAANRDRLGLLP